MRQIPDLMLCFQELNDGTVRQIRKTSEDPPRVSIFDVIQVVAKVQNPRKTWETLKSNYPEVVSSGYNFTDFQFPGQGQRSTPVCEIRMAVEIVMLLPGRASAAVRAKAADCLVRYVGGDLTMVQEVAANRLRQEDMDDDDPARLFGQTVESEAIKRKREEVTLLELDSQAKRIRVQAAADVERIRVQAATDVATITLDALKNLGLPISDRDRMLAKDMITTAAFTQGQLEDRGEEADICLQQFCASRVKKGQEAMLGRKAKKLYLEENPGYQFAKKTIFAQGQMVEANRWTASMASYLERALEAI